MQIRTESYPDRIRRLADELSKFREKFDVDQSVEKLRMIANEVEYSFKKPPRKKG